MPRPEDVIRVAVVGAVGKMGSEVCRTLFRAHGIDHRHAIDRQRVGEPLRSVIGPDVADLTIEDRLGAALDADICHVMIDFTHPTSATSNALTALKRGVAPVIGTSGVSSENLREIADSCKEFQTPAMVVPNFAIGAVLMMKFAEMAARWMPDAEVIEMHHDQKADAPSGTARSTAERIGAARRLAQTRRPTEIIGVEGVRGGTVKGVAIHSVRLKGLVAHQQVLFGGEGETLTIRHDSLARSSFMGGVELCIREIWNQTGLVVGMDTLIR